MDFSGRHFPTDLMLQTIRWYLRYNLSYRDLGEILEERGVEIHHTTPYRWVQEYAPQLETDIENVRSLVEPPGVWMKRTSKSKASGSASTGQSIQEGIQWTSC